MKIEVSNGEIADKITILQIKLERVQDKSKLSNIQKEYDELTAVFKTPIDTLYSALYKVNCELWDIEDNIRDLEKNEDFGKEFISLARAIHVKNEIRTELKRQINVQTNSNLIEEKYYRPYHFFFFAFVFFLLFILTFAFK